MITLDDVISVSFIIGILVGGIVMAGCQWVAG
jgi:hypothetical protein